MVFEQAGQDKYLDADEYGGAIRRAFTYIAKHHVPPSKFTSIGSPTPSVSTTFSTASQSLQSPSSAVISKLEDLATASKASVPLEEGSWLYVEITCEIGDQMVGRTRGGVEVNSQKNDWRPSWRMFDGVKAVCYVFVAPSREVYYTWTLEPNMHLDRQAKGK